jgi:hypothetical protein
MLPGSDLDLVPFRFACRILLAGNSETPYNSYATVFGECTIEIVVLFADDVVMGLWVNDGPFLGLLGGARYHVSLSTAVADSRK